MSSTTRDFQLLSDQSIHDELCLRLKAARLEANITQSELADRAGVSLITVKRAESGNGNITMMTLIALLRALNRLDQLKHFLPEPPLSPLSIQSSVRHERQRASGSHRLSGSYSHSASDRLKVGVAESLKKDDQVNIGVPVKSRKRASSRKEKEGDSSSAGWKWGDET